MDKLTVVILCYNHERFLTRALESVLAQKTIFEYRIIVADDASTDSSREIIHRYAESYPRRIVPILREHNLGSMENFRRTLAALRSEYVIINDGDDWFCDTGKLQKQVEYLDTHPECALCFHPVRIERDEDCPGDDLFPQSQDWKDQELQHLLKLNFMQTNSVMYRWAFNDGSLLQHLPGGIVPGDHFLHLLHAEKGKIGFLPEIMAVYYRHKGSLWDGDAQTSEWFIRCAEPHIRFYQEVEKRYGVSMREKIQFMRKHHQLARSGGAGFLQQIVWYILSKCTRGEIRKMYKSLYKMSFLRNKG